MTASTLAFILLGFALISLPFAMTAAISAASIEDEGFEPSRPDGDAKLHAGSNAR